MEPGIAEILGPRSPEPKILRVLWRMQGATRVIVARIEGHPYGLELSSPCFIRGRSLSWRRFRQATLLLPMASGF
jgi:hypothetical protein